MNRPGPGQPPQLGASSSGDNRLRVAHGGARPPSGRRRKQQGMGIMSWIVLGVLSAMGLMGGAAAVFVLTMPKDFVRDSVTAEVKRQTGRDLVIAGPAGFKLFPSIGISLGDVSLSAPEGTTTDKPLVQMASLDVSVRLLPLLNRQVTIERLVLQKPVFELHVDANGRKSWDMAARASKHLIRVAQAQPPGTASDAPANLPQEAQDFLNNSGAPEPQHTPRAENASSAGLNQLELGDVRIEDGTVNYSDARSGARQSVSAINMRLELKSLSQPLEAKGDLVWNAEKVALDGSLTSVKSVIEQQPAKIAMKIDSPRVAGTFDGTVSVKDSVDAQGKLTAKASSTKALAKWLGTELPPVPGFGPLDFASDVRAAGKTVALSNANISLDGATLTGQVSVDAGGAKPHVTGALTVSELDLNKYIGSDGSAGTAPPQAIKLKPAADGLSPARPAAPTPPGPRVQGFTQRASSTGWSEGQIDASALGLADADLKLTLGKLVVNKIKVGKSQLTVALKDAVMKTTFDDVELYGGRGKGLVTVDATQPLVVAVGSNLSLDAIQAQPLLKDAADMDMLAGTGKVTVAVSGRGQSQRQIIETLTGQSDFSIANGAIVGWNIPAIVRGVSQGRLSGLDRTPSEKTDFSELVSTWTITNGLAQNQDLRLVSPLLRVSGAGNVMLPAREIDYLLKPSLVATLEGQGAATQSQGLEIPVHITGSWAKPKLKPDASGILKDPNQAIQAVKDLGKQFKGKNAQEIVDGLFGSKSNDDTGAAPADGKSSDKEKAKKLLEGLFKN